MECDILMSSKDDRMHLLDSMIGKRNSYIPLSKCGERTWCIAINSVDMVKQVKDHCIL